MESSIIQIDNYLVSAEIVTEYFCCNYQICKGVCCIIGDSGAPLEEYEAQDLEREFPKYKDWMSSAGQSKIKQTGFFEIDSDGDMVTPLLGNVEECAYSRFEDGNCYCAIERSYCAGKSSFAKPISCRLYPIRVSKLSNGMTALNLHRWPICKDAFTKGKKERLRVFEFLKEPIIFQFGHDFYSVLEAASRTFNAIS